MAAAPVQVFVFLLAILTCGVEVSSHGFVDGSGKLTEPGAEDCQDPQQLSCDATASSSILQKKFSVQQSVVTPDSPEETLRAGGHEEESIDVGQRSNEESEAESGNRGEDNSLEDQSERADRKWSPKRVWNGAKKFTKKVSNNVKKAVGKLKNSKIAQKVEKIVKDAQKIEKEINKRIDKGIRKFKESKVGKLTKQWYDRLSKKCFKTDAACSILLSDFCDCSHRQSYIKLGSTSEMKCTPKKGTPITNFFSFGSGSSEWKSRSGSRKRPSRRSHRRRPHQRRRLGQKQRIDISSRRRGGWWARWRKPPRRYLEQASEVKVEILPTVTWKKSLTQTELTLDGEFFASIDFSVKADQNVCRGVWEKTHRKKKPIHKVICNSAGCLMLLMWPYATFRGELPGCQDGEIAGTARIDAPFMVNVVMKAVDMHSSHVIHKIGTPHHTVSLSANTVGSAKFSAEAGLSLVVWPVPGLPITVTPFVRIELLGTVGTGGRLKQSVSLSETDRQFSQMRNSSDDDASLKISRDSHQDGMADGATDSGAEVLQTSKSNSISDTDSAAETSFAEQTGVCLAANVIANITLELWGIPPSINLDTKILKDAIKEAMTLMATMVTKKLDVFGKCMGPLSTLSKNIKKAAKKAGGALAKMIPSLKIKVQQPHKNHNFKIFKIPLKKCSR
eukprot:TRINITY_DN24332_c0_g1_i2.p1 TRINITY_DN24332_c0_g1~~TRINITY_DN24332_c0_g1_i2.p1  ORF type:complete len:674 (-),score=86.43 TRINITY_DN24332_c0_g1_i2:93-2114(-)